MFSKRFFLFFLVIIYLVSGCVQLRFPMLDSSDPASPCGGPSCLHELAISPLTEERAVAIALQNNRHLAAAYDRLEIAKAGLYQAGLLPNPIFSLAYRFSTQGGFPALIDINLMHNLLETLLIPWKKRMAAKELEITEQMLAQMMLEVAGQTRMAFYDVQAKTEILSCNRELLQAADASCDATYRLWQAGNVRSIDLLDQQIALERARTLVGEGERDLIDAQERLNALMGLWGCQIAWEYTPSLPPVPSEDCYLHGELEIIAQSIELAIAKKHLEAAASGVKLNILRTIFPQCETGIATERDEGIWYAGPAFAIALPFFDFGQAKVRAAQGEIYRQWDLLNALAIELRAFARNVQFQVASFYKQIGIYQEKIVPSAEKLTYETLLQNNGMQIGVVELLAVKQEEIQRKIEHLRLQRDYWLARTVLDTLYSGHKLFLNNEL